MVPIISFALYYFGAQDKDRSKNKKERKKEYSIGGQKREKINTVRKTEKSIGFGQFC